MSKLRGRHYLDEPNMSDQTLLVSVEDLINRAMGPPEENSIDYKMLQTVLHILARLMRVLETEVEITFPDDDDETIIKNKAEREKEIRKKQEVYKEMEERKMAKMTLKEMEKYLKEKKQEEQKIQKMSPQEKQKYLKAKKKIERNMAPDEMKIIIRETEIEKMPRHGEDSYVKQKNQKEIAKMSPTEKEKYIKHKEVSQIANMSPKEKAKHVKDKEEKEMAEMSPKEKKEYVKEKEILSKMSPKEKEKYLKEKEEREMAKMSPKEKEEYLKEKKILSKMSPKEKAKYAKDKEKREVAKMSHKEKEKYFKEKEEIKVAKMSPKKMEIYLKEQEEREIAKMSPKEKKKYLKEKEQREIAKMSLKEGEKYVEERRERDKTSFGKTTAIKDPRRRSSGGIDIVTQSEFRWLENTVMELKEKAGPLPMPTLPDNKQLRSDLVTGNASLSEVMDTMQVSARVQVAEEALGRMAKLLTQLAMAGALPEEIGEQIQKITADLETSSAEIDQKPETELDLEPGEPKSASRTESIDSAVTAARSSPGASSDHRSSTSRLTIEALGDSAIDVIFAPGPITRDQMEDALLGMKEDLMNNVYLMTKLANSTAMMASSAAQRVADELEVAINLNNHINALYNQTEDYAEQLAGFDSGYTTQIQNFKDIILNMTADLEGGLVRLEQVNNNIGTTAILDLTLLCQEVLSDLDRAQSEHQHLSSIQEQQCVDMDLLKLTLEMLEEQKEDRDELYDGIRDKAHISQLQGLVTEKRFESTRVDLEMKLAACYNKFSKQKATCISAVNDLTATMESKAEINRLLSMKNDAQEALLALQDRLQLLALQLEQPQAAILMRMLSKDRRSALIRSEDTTYGQYFSLPALRPPPEGGDSCVPQWIPPAPTDKKQHICHRWVGGSHTLMWSGEPRVAPPLPPPRAPLRRYTTLGSDGNSYLMAEALLPCIECNQKETSPKNSIAKPKFEIPKPYQGGADDNKLTTKIREPVCDCLPDIPVIQFIPDC